MKTFSAIPRPSKKGSSTWSDSQRWRRSVKLNNDHSALRFPNLTSVEQAGHGIDYMIQTPTPLSNVLYETGTLMIGK